MNLNTIVLVAFGAVTLGGSAAYTFARANALEARIRSLETRLEAAESRAAAKSVALSTANAAPQLSLVSAPTSSVATPSVPAYTVLRTAVATPAESAPLEERVRRLEKELAPHMSFISQSTGQ